MSSMLKIMSVVDMSNLETKSRLFALETRTWASRRTTQSVGSPSEQGTGVPPPRTRHPLDTGVARLGDMTPLDPEEYEDMEDIPIEEIMWY